MLCHPSDYDFMNKPQWIIKTYNLFKIIKKIFPLYPTTGFLYYHINRINKLKNNIDNQKIIYKTYLDLFRNSNDDIKFFIVQIFDIANIVNDEISEEILKFAFSTKNRTYRYWLTMDISKYTFMLHKGFYEAYYTDRKELFRKICEDYNFKFNMIGDPKDSVCVICYLLDKTNKNSAQRVAEMYSNGLSSFFSQVDIVVLDTFSPSLSEKRNLTTLYKRKKSKSFQKFTIKQFDKNVMIHYPKGRCFAEKMQYVLDVIGSINPRAIIDISDEYSPISFVYSKYIPTFYQPLRGYASSSYFNYIFGEKKRYEACNKKFKSIDLNSVIEFCFPEYVPPKTKGYTKKEIGFSDSSFIVVSIGNSQNAFDLDFIKAIIKVMEKYDDIVWVFVGHNYPVKIQEAYETFLKEKRIVFRGYEENLSGFCSACDVLLRGNISGGSGGTAIAAMQKLPIVMTDFLCDATRWIGSDYSNLHTYDDVANELEKLYLDHDYYLKRSAVSYERVMKVANSKEKWSELSEIIKSKT